MIDINEEKLVSDLKRKDEESLKLIMDKYSNRLLRTVYMIVKDKDLAEDVVQDTFIKLFNNINQFNKASSLYTYIYSIAVNECRMKLRKNWFKKVVLFENFKQSEGSESFEDKRLDKLTLKESILNLDLKYREVILLYYYEDMSISDISKITGDKEGTIKSKLKRARDILKDLLIKEGFEYEE